MRRTLVSRVNAQASSLSAHQVAIIILFILVGIAFIGFTIWLAILSPALARSSHNKSDISTNGQDINDVNQTVNNNSQTIIELTQNITNVNNSIADPRAILSSVRVIANNMEVPPGVNLPYDDVVHDPFGLYDLPNYQWVSDRDGWFELTSCVTFDFGSTDLFPVTVGYDAQLQVFINGGVALQGLFLAIFSSLGSTAPSQLPQQSVCGTYVYSMSTNDTLAIRIQTRIFPAIIVNSTINGGAVSLTRATFRFVGT